MPAVTPVTAPLLMSTEALVPAVLHVPPAGVLVRVTVLFTHTAMVPVGTDGNAFTITVIVR